MLQVNDSPILAVSILEWRHCLSEVKNYRRHADTSPSRHSITLNYTFLWNPKYIDLYN